MKKIPAVLALAIAFFAGAVTTAQVRDVQDLDNVRKQVTAAIGELERARAANHYDMQGHGAKAEQLLKQAEQELNLAINAAAKAKH
jgi:hypothetical protein